MDLPQRAIAQTDMIVAGRPAPRPRSKARAMRVGKRVVAQVYQPLPARGWKEAIQAKAELTAPVTPWEGPVALWITFIFPLPPKPAWRRITWAGRACEGTQGDGDNLTNVVMDALQGIWYVNDRQVTDFRVRKRWTGRAEGAMLLEASLMERPPQTQAEAKERGWPPFLEEGQK